jgi:hypothetical protein
MRGKQKRALDTFHAQPSAGRAPGRHALSGECPPAPACGRHLLLYFASKGMAAQHPTHRRLRLEAWLHLLTASRKPQAEPLSGR